METKEEMETRLRDEISQRVEELVADRLAQAQLDRARETASEKPTTRNCRALIDAEDQHIKTTDPDRYSEMAMFGQCSWQEQPGDDYSDDYDYEH